MMLSFQLLAERSCEIPIYFGFIWILLVLPWQIFPCREGWRAGRDHPEPQQSLAGSELHIPTSGDGTDKPGGTAGHGNPMAWDWAGNMHSSAGFWGFLSPRKVENKVLNKCLLQWKTGIV